MKLQEGHKSKTKTGSEVTVLSVEDNLVYYRVDGLHGVGRSTKDRFIKWLKETNQWKDEE